MNLILTNVGNTVFQYTRIVCTLYCVSTKKIYIQSTTVNVLSSELGLSHPFSRQRVCPSPQNQRRTGGTLACVLGVRGVPIPTGEKLRTLPTLGVCLFLRNCCYIVGNKSVFLNSLWILPYYNFNF